MDMEDSISETERYPCGIHPTPLHPMQFALCTAACGRYELGWDGVNPYEYMPILDMGYWISTYIHLFIIYI